MSAERDEAERKCKDLQKSIAEKNKFSPEQESAMDLVILDCKKKIGEADEAKINEEFSKQDSASAAQFDDMMKKKTNFPHFLTTWPPWWFFILQLFLRPGRTNT